MSVVVEDRGSGERGVGGVYVNVYGEEIYVRECGGKEEGCCVAAGALAMRHVRRENDVLNIGHKICVYDKVLRFRSICGMRDYCIEREVCKGVVEYASRCKKGVEEAGHIVRHVLWRPEE